MSGASFHVVDPATEEPIAELPDASAADALDALAAAHGAFPAWRAVAPRARSEILRRAYELMMDRQAELAALITSEMGKPLSEARGEVAYAAGYLRWYAEEAVRIEGRCAVAESGAGRVVTMGQPVGPCLFITPWNFPLAMGARKLAPALAAGCTCVVKPAAQTPLSTLAMAALLEEAGVPAGVVNVVTTTSSAEVVASLMADGRTRKLSFTGSTAVGKLLIAQGAEQVLRMSMELGGNAPFVVFDDVDLDAAVEGALQAKMRNGGQACTSANRFLVHEAVAARFAARLASRMSALRIGPGTLPGSDVGPLIDAAQIGKVEQLVADAVDQGATALCGGRRPARRGYFYEPTVLVDVPPSSRVLREEIFGPVAPILTFTDEAEAIAEANATQFGLIAYLYTRDLDRAWRVSEALETGMVGVNQGIVANPGAPFGGVKHSGFGREGGPEGLQEYLETKYLAVGAGAGS